MGFWTFRWVWVLRLRMYIYIALRPKRCCPPRLSQYCRAEMPENGGGSLFLLNSLPCYLRGGFFQKLRVPGRQKNWRDSWDGVKRREKIRGMVLLCVCFFLQIVPLFCHGQRLETFEGGSTLAPAPSASPLGADVHLSVYVSMHL